MNSAYTNSSASTRRFDDAAAGWEAKPQRLVLAAAVAAGIRRILPPRSEELSALEYGCGTGLVCRALSPVLGRITAMDTSSGMLRELEERLRGEGIGNVLPMLHDLTREPLADVAFDVIYCSMTLHHIPEPELLLRRFFAALRPGGLLAMADLAPEDGSFHEDNSGVAHFGIDPRQLLGWYERLGGRDGQSDEVHVIEKNSRRYPVLLTWCRGA